MSRDGYGRDLATVHHRDFGWAARGAAQTLLGELRRRSLKHGLVVDLGAGSGIFAKAVSNAGYDVLGVELSPAMLRIAKREAPRARFVRASVIEFDPPSCIAVTAIGEVLNYRFAAAASWANLVRVCRRVHRALVPGGVFLFDLSGPGRGGPTGIVERFRDENDYSMFLRTQENARRNLLTRDHVLFVRSGERYKKIEERHVLRLFDSKKTNEMLRAIGFSVKHLPGYPGGPKLPGWSVFLAGRPRGRRPANR